MKTLTEKKLLEFLRQSKTRHLNLNEWLKQYFGEVASKYKKKKLKKKNK